MNKRTISNRRATLETTIDLELNIDGGGLSKIDTGIGFLDHMLSTLARHANFDLTLSAKGDILVDDHHTVEDSALALGEALSDILGERRGIVRFGYAYAPLDEALARAVIDLSGRPYSVVNLHLKRDLLGSLASENIAHWFSSIAVGLKAAIHIDVLRGYNDHHRAEAAFKAFALALRQSVLVTANDSVPSTKGRLV
ncbi:MAG: imidazoleglycerol-phosphate dehydratase HisB [Deltaproteobacteria bacterium]|nr:imidazoleglycerol-phosphate dehydratase HisB [Deltaproteobacteria bacterium]